MKRRTLMLSALAVVLTPAVSLPAPTGPDGSNKPPFDRFNIQRVRSQISEYIRDVYMFYVEYANDPTDSITRLRLVTGIETHFDNLVKAGIVYEFKVVCDDANNPQRILDTGLPQLDVFWKLVNHNIGGHEQMSIGPQLNKEHAA